MAETGQSVSQTFTLATFIKASKMKIKVMRAAKTSSVKRVTYCINAHKSNATSRRVNSDNHRPCQSE